MVRMIEIAREHGSHANFSGSGGAAVGICGGDSHYAELEKAYARENYRIIKVRIAADPAGRS
jgi:hypothetical protein